MSKHETFVQWLKISIACILGGAYLLGMIYIIQLLQALVHSCTNYLIS